MENKSKYTVLGIKKVSLLCFNKKYEISTYQEDKSTLADASILAGTSQL